MPAPTLLGDIVCASVTLQVPNRTPGNDAPAIQMATGGQLVLRSGNGVRLTQSNGTTINLASDNVGLGFFGAATVAQPVAAGVVAGFVAGAGAAVLDDSTFTGAVGATAYTIGDIVAALKTLGLITT